MSLEGAALFYSIAGPLIMFLAGYLLKHELNDIKTRIVRLENIFLHRNGRNGDHDED